LSDQDLAELKEIRLTEKFEQLPLYMGFKWGSEYLDDYKWKSKMLK